MKTITFLIIFLIGLKSLEAQINPTIYNSAGGSATLAGGGYLAWSIGEPMIGTAATSSATITQGFLQTWPNAMKNLMLTLYLEGLFNGTRMNKAMNAASEQFAGDVADKINVELHNATNYSTIIYTGTDIPLSTTGHASLSIPGADYGSYYVTVKHRNSIETTTAAPVSFAGSSIQYAFDAPAKAYNGNLKQLSPTIYGLYAGDVNADGKVDASDLNLIQTSATAFITGYLTADVNGDGAIDAFDLIMTDNNSSTFVKAQKP